MPDIVKIVSFLQSIGLAARIQDLSSPEWDECFLPGVLLKHGSLKIDRVAIAGDILHEAGHLAIFPHRIRHYTQRRK
jgi:hypothetical protein